MKRTNDFKKEVVITEPDVTGSLKEIKIKEIIDMIKKLKIKFKINNTRSIK